MQGVELLVEGLLGGGHGVGVGQQQAAGLGEGHAVAAPVEQALGVVLLEFGHVLRHGRLADEQGLGRFGETQVLGHGLEHAETEIRHGSKVNETGQTGYRRLHQLGLPHQKASGNLPGALAPGFGANRLLWGFSSGLFRHRARAKAPETETTAPTPALKRRAKPLSQFGAEALRTNRLSGGGRASRHENEIGISSTGPDQATNQRVGKYTVNVEPRPSSDCTSMRPPAFSTIFFTM